MTLGEKIIDLRKKRGLSQEELAITLGVSRQAVSKWEVGESTPDTDKVIALAEYFGVTTDSLLRDAAPESAAPTARAIPTPSEMLRGAPMLQNLVLGGNIAGLALMLFDLWQQTYYHIPTILGLLLQIAMCALFCGFCASLAPHDAENARRLRRAYWRASVFLLAPMPCFWAGSVLIGLWAQWRPLSTTALLPLWALLYAAACLIVRHRTR